MGNQNATISCTPAKQPHSKKLSKIIVSKRTSQTKPTNNDSFIIKHIQQNRNIDNDTLQSPSDQRRVVFVSLIGLYTSWKNVPPSILYTALLLIPLRKAWIYNPAEYINELKTSFLSEVTAFGDINETQQFIELLKWKDSQQLVMWILDFFDEYRNPIPVEITTKGAFTNPLVAQFWFELNNKLTSLYDHITGDNYLPLHLDEKWWKNKDNFISKYGTKASSILSEYYFLTMKYSTMSEIIYQSNPKSLHPVIVYRNRSNTKCFSKINVNVNKRRNRLKLKKMCVMSPLSPIKEKHFKKDGSNARTPVSETPKTNIISLDNFNPYLQVIKELDENGHSSLPSDS